MNTMFIYSKLRYRVLRLQCERIYRFYDAIIVFITWNTAISFGKELLHFFFEGVYANYEETSCHRYFVSTLGK
ncbi:hypothetical protein SRABI133_01813 [Peribacillus simplex]|uniref:Uncharacterized protein n=1 Tax=Peribacillus simplex TaxID=1478 RepID=A0A9W4KRW6_9BACI|nr:hypothetical protein SRABI133_01813 [Peribacillus simplex]